MATLGTRRRYYSIMSFRAGMGCLAFLAASAAAGLRAEAPQAGPAPLGQEAERPISIVVDMTPEGRKVERPTPDHPAYYFPYVGGYKDLGAKVAGEPQPPVRETIAGLARALASQGYLVTHQLPADPKAPKSEQGQLKLSPPPSLILVFNWGTLNPVTVDGNADVTGTDPPTVLNQAKMMGLLGGKALDNLQPEFTTFNDLMDDTQMNHFFVTVMAYDFDSYIRLHKKVNLWNAKIAIDSDGLNLPAVMPQLITAATPYLGRETTRPVSVPAPVGEVKVGTPEVKGYIAPPAK